MAKRDELRTSREKILHHVLSYCLTRRFGDDALRPGHAGFTVTGMSGPHQPRPGDLVVLDSAPASKWTIGWLLEVGKDRSGGARYLIQALDGEPCWWGNVGVEYLDRDVVEKHPEWRWTDRQWAFDDLWRSIANDEIAPLARPMRTEFGDGKGATIGVATWHSDDLLAATRTLTDWRRTTKARLLRLAAECRAEVSAEIGRCLDASRDKKKS